MNIKGVNFDPVDSVSTGRYARHQEAAETRSAARTQARVRSLSREEVAEVVNRLNEGVRDLHERLSFSFHEKTGRVIVKVVNGSTDEVLREIPEKEAIKLLEHIQDFLGMLVDETR
ncbi:MAG: flagellar protein FlaG [Spirochaetes bacterium]|nr:flagellar protein FlaG [Spirochaetota bacterium]